MTHPASSGSKSHNHNPQSECADPQNCVLAGRGLTEEGLAMGHRMGASCEQQARARSSAHGAQTVRFGPHAGLTVAEMNATVHENCAQWPDCRSCDGSAPEIEDIHCAESDAQNHDRLWIVSGSNDLYFASHSEARAIRWFGQWLSEGHSADLYRVKPKAMREVMHDQTINHLPLIVGTPTGSEAACKFLHYLVEVGKEIVTLNV